MPKRAITTKNPSASHASASNRRQRHSAELRERLFRSALSLFATKGFAETTVEDITEAADVGKGTFFNYFPSKDHILLPLARCSSPSSKPPSKPLAKRMNRCPSFSGRWESA